MDRIEEWRAFVAVATQRSFTRAARQLRRSPQAITRAVASVETRLGTRLLHRTTRAVSLTSDGERYLERGRSVVAELDLLEAPLDASAPLSGQLAITAPVLFGTLHVAPIVHAFLAAHPAASVRLMLTDRVVALAEEGLDVGVRIGALPDSALRARVVGHVRLLTCASPAYLARAGTPRTPDAIARHACIAFTGTTSNAERWTFTRAGERPRHVAVQPRLVVDTAQAAIDAALAGVGIVRVLSYQVDALVAAGQLVRLVPRHEPAPVPVQLVALPGIRPRLARVFVEHAAAELARRLATRPGAVRFARSGEV